MSTPVPPPGAADPQGSRPAPEPAPAGPGGTPDVVSPPLRIEAPSPDVVIPGAATGLPGEHRGGFTTPPTAPVELAAFVPRGPDEDEDAAPRRGTASIPVTTSATWNPGAYALLFAITGLVASFVVGWLFPLGILGVVFAAIALRRPSQRRRGAWALPLAILSLLYSAGWILFGLLA